MKKFVVSAIVFAAALAAAPVGAASSAAPLTCNTGASNAGRIALGSACVLHFQDANLKRGVVVCFTTDAPNVIKLEGGGASTPASPGPGVCVKTRAHGKAAATFLGKAIGSPVVTATSADTSQTPSTVTITVFNPKKK